MKVLSWKGLAGGALAAVVALLLASFATSLHSAEAQPPSPPNRFFGSVTLDGAPAAAGTVVTAQIGGVECGSTTVVTGETFAYIVDAVSDGEISGCGSAGATVSFLVGGNTADQTASWTSGDFTQLDLTASSAAAPTATPPPPPTEGPAEATPTTVIVVTPFGSGGDLGGGSGTAWWAIATGAGVLALAGSAGWVAYRRAVR
jgi:hypothetical protein